MVIPRSWVQGKLAILLALGYVAETLVTKESRTVGTRGYQQDPLRWEPPIREIISDLESQI